MFSASLNCPASPRNRAVIRQLCRAGHSLCLTHFLPKGSEHFTSAIESVVPSLLLQSASDVERKAVRNLRSANHSRVGRYL
eukprot:754601-Hanusia_phi.AAC.3